MKKIDRELFNWFSKKNDRSDIYLPVLWHNFQLNYFDSESENFIVKDDWEAFDALQFSLDFYGISDLNLGNLARILKICRRFAIDPEDLEVFSKYGIKGRIAFDNLNKFLMLDFVLQEYFGHKKLPLKYVRQIFQFKDNLKKILKDFIIQKSPSIGDFRNFINFLSDYGYFIDVDTYYDELMDEITRKRDKKFYEFEDRFREAVNQFKIIEVKNITNFETSELLISFVIKDLSDLDAALVEVSDKNRFNSIFKILEEYDLS
ncbi:MULTISPECIES: hypothetical protein [Calditerrivibrio]|uniref:hypothetical protein n=1 Tax=Calditerrivibrio TaxID=545865 RepID=UPI003C77028A